MPSFPPIAVLEHWESPAGNEKTIPYMLQRTNEALADLRTGRFEDAAVLVP
jgi:hypothetical protein